ncbi:MAG TPA: LEA type 2 family protein [Chitinophagaceae bacterium]
MKRIFYIVPLLAIIIVSCGTNHIKEPEYRDVRNIRLIELGPLQSTAGVDLVYYNPNKFGVQVSDARGDIYVDSSFFGKFELSDRVQVKKLSEFTLPALVKVDMIGALKNQRDLLKKKQVLVRLEGIATLRKAGVTREIPIKYESLQDIDKFRAVISHQ